jgi:asparagine synthetase B (glutamine-hydrolysing)
MCGIFGAVSDTKVDLKLVKELAIHSMQRGKDSSGLLWAGEDGNYRIVRSDDSIKVLLESLPDTPLKVAAGHSRLITNGMGDNQPIIRDEIYVIHNGIVVNHESLWEKLELSRELESDTEIIAAIAAKFVENFGTLTGCDKEILRHCQGAMSCVIFSPMTAEVLLFSNTGSLYQGTFNGSHYFSSEGFPLVQIGIAKPSQVTEGVVLAIAPGESSSVVDSRRDRAQLVQSFSFSSDEESMLEYEFPDIRRCTRCVLPFTMPFIKFDSMGVCNYCNNYRIQNSPKPASQLSELIHKYRRSEGPEAIMPLSGGRDSSFALHLVAKEFNIKTIAYTYDWGMVTDLGRRNISRMCSILGVENIVIAADIAQKRKNIQKNLKA